MPESNSIFVNYIVKVFSKTGRSGLIVKIISMIHIMIWKIF